MLEGLAGEERRASILRRGELHASIVGTERLRASIVPQIPHDAVLRDAADAVAEASARRPTALTLGTASGTPAGVALHGGVRTTPSWRSRHAHAVTHRQRRFAAAPPPLASVGPPVYLSVRVRVSL